MNKKIAIVHDFLTKLGGAERVLESMHEIFPEAPIYTLIYDKKGTKNRFEKNGYNIITSSLQKIPKFFRRQRFLFPKFPAAIEQFNFDDFDIVISSSNSFAHGIITGPTTLHVCYCYSPTRYLWDWYHEYLDENKIGFGLKGLFIRNVLHKIRIWDKLACERPDVWIAISEHVKKRIQKYYRKDAKVIYSPTDTKNIPFSLGDPENYYLIISRLEPYKKIDYAINAFNSNKKQLVIIGTGSEEERLKKIAGNNIEFLGWQPDKSVYKYMGSAKALIFPGEEDFGLTPVESMATGRPVIAYNKGGVSETVIDKKTGIVYNIPDEPSLNKAIGESEKIRFSTEACRNRANEFSLEIFIKKILNLIEQEYEKFTN